VSARLKKLFLCGIESDSVLWVCKSVKEVEEEEEEEEEMVVAVVVKLEDGLDFPGT